MPTGLGVHANRLDLPSAPEPASPLPYSASRTSCKPQDEDLAIPEGSMDARHCAQIIEDYHVLDFDPRLNTSSYVNVTFEPEEEKIALMGLKVNLADQTVYPSSFKLHNDCLNMIAKLWHCPKPSDFQEQRCYPGAGCIGSTEACLLGGLALKFRWREFYRKKHGLTADEVRRVYPNMVISTMYQACWEKFFKYMDVEPRFIVPSGETFVMDPCEIKGVVDDKTIGIVCILGNHYCGQYDPVWEVDKILSAINDEMGLQLGIHVDAASGGFVAPYQDWMPVWDFRLKNVLSISASGHKFGNSSCGTGWIVWRHRKGLSDTVAINVSYLGGSADSYTLNFSRPAQGIYVQFYKLLRLGHAGYRAQVDNQMAIAAYLRKGLAKMKHEGKPLFTIIDAVGQAEQKICLPVVSARFNLELSLSFDEIDLQDVVAWSHWYLSGYRLSAKHPVTEETIPLCKDLPAEQAMFRIVVKNNLSINMASHLLDAIHKAVEYLVKHNIGPSTSNHTIKLARIAALEKKSEERAAGKEKLPTLLSSAEIREGGGDEITQKVHIKQYDRAVDVSLKQKRITKHQETELEVFPEQNAVAHRSRYIELGMCILILVALVAFQWKHFLPLSEFGTEV